MNKPIKIKTLDKVREISLKKVIKNIDLKSSVKITKDSLIFLCESKGK